jgi:hypothetical protein
MDASTVSGTAGRSNAEFQSRPGALAWFFRKSRDLWKSKVQVLRVALKYERNQVAAVTKSREQWRSKAQQAAAESLVREQELEALRRENETLRTQVQELAEQPKKSWSAA